MRNYILALSALLIACLAGLAFCGVVDAATPGEILATAGLAFGMSYAVGDAALSVSIALPTGASAVTSSSIDLGHNSTGANLADYEFLISAPALNSTQLPNSQTMTYAIVTSASADLSSPTVVNASVLVQTGADSVGADAATARYRLPTDCQRYVGVKATKSGSGDASAASVVLSAKF